MAIRLKERNPAIEALANMKYIDLQKAVIERGMDFELVVNSDHSKLSSFFMKHFDSRIDPLRPLSFDHWMDQKMQERGYKTDDPVRQFKRFTPEVVEKEEKPKKIPKEKPKKIPKERDAGLGIYVGTRKHFTMKLAETLKTKFGKKYSNKELINRFIAQVMRKIDEKFPNQPANEKSVKIWLKRALDAIKE